MEKAGYVFLAIAAFGWLAAIVVGLVAIFPWGLFGFCAKVGLGILFAKVLKERIANKEDDHYSKKVEK